MATGSNLFLEGPCIVLGNAAKWAWVKDPVPHFDLMIIDDAKSPNPKRSLFMQIAGLADRFLIVHSAIPNRPIVRSETKRWDHMNHAPHHSITHTIPRYTHLNQGSIHKQCNTHSYRLPQDTTVDTLYPHVFPLAVTTENTKSRLEIPNTTHPLWDSVNAGTSLVMYHIQDTTSVMARAEWIADSITTLLHQQTIVHDTRMQGRLTPAKIGSYAPIIHRSY